MNNVLIDDRRIFVDFSQSGELIILPIIYIAATSVPKFRASQHQTGCALRSVAILSFSWTSNGVLLSFFVCHQPLSETFLPSVSLQRYLLTLLFNI